ncbi:MAG: hypothetical protein Q4F31_09885 [Eubacteriales bacterium]|nr:hypothetical protein [Eubacteriales bacterium]
MDQSSGANKSSDLAKLLSSEIISGYSPLSFEEADRILQNILSSCGYYEAHLKKENIQDPFGS